jgi:hypothetical protein
VFGTLRLLFPTFGVPFFFLSDFSVGPVIDQDHVVSSCCKVAISRIIMEQVGARSMVNNLAVRVLRIRSV